MSNGQHPIYGHNTISGPAIASKGGAPLPGAVAPASAAAPSLCKRLGIEVAPGDMRGLLPDLAGIGLLVVGLGTYGGFW